MAFKDTIKQYFQEGDYPSEAQFIEFFNSIFFKDETIGIENVTDLQSMLNQLALPVDPVVVTATNNHTYALQVGYVLEKIVIRPVSNCTPSAVYANDTENVIVAEDSIEVTPADGKVWTVDVFAPVVVKQILVQNVPEASVIYFVKRKIF